MNVSYKGHKLTVTKEKSLGGYNLLYYSIFRESDGYECMSGFENTVDTVRTLVKAFKERIDNELKEEDPWMEKARKQ